MAYFRMVYGILIGSTVISSYDSHEKLEDAPSDLQEHAIRKT